MATVSNRPGTVTVTATDRGQPLEVRIEQRELRYGSGRLATAILEMCRASAAEAKVRRREDLARAGVRADVLDRLGLPTRAELARAQRAEESDEPAPTSWMRPL
ncbi:hypothetical protein FK531_19155 [Rhodococcus spelaei]|uniref:Uncharacterized protein n=1 Tax=Rhodococcus spelaei TaxID=2546320 RepID=A0A541B1D8_9NOCA|nr:hypothetical protein FK531_19155 [Rhodococcus spelaei]